MTGVIIGRFQVPHLHPGHIHLIASALQKFDRVIVLLGCANKVDERNLYSWMHRVEIIHKVFPHVPVHLLHDMNTDEEWSSQIDKILLALDKPTLVHSRDSFKDHYKGMFNTYEVEELKGYSGTELRKEKKYDWNRRFHLSQKQIDKYIAWHDSLPEKYYGATSTGITFEFPECSIGTIVKVSRADGHNLDLTDWENF
jgi:cytidyltransferase-like protein